MNRDSTEKLSVTPTVEFPNLKAEKFLEKRINEDQSISYYVKWKDHGFSSSTWVNSEDLRNEEKMIKNFEKAEKKKKKNRDKQMISNAGKRSRNMFDMSTEGSTSEGSIQDKSSVASSPDHGGVVANVYGSKKRFRTESPQTLKLLESSDEMANMRKYQDKAMSVDSVTEKANSVVLSNPKGFLNSSRTQFGPKKVAAVDGHECELSRGLKKNENILCRAATAIGSNVPVMKPKRTYNRKQKNQAAVNKNENDECGCEANFGEEDYLGTIMTAKKIIGPVGDGGGIIDDMLFLVEWNEADQLPGHLTNKELKEIAPQVLIDYYCDHLKMS